MSRVCLSRLTAPALVVAVLLTAPGCRPHGREALERGDQLLEARKPTEAIPLLEVAATDLPGDARAWNFLGLAYHSVGRRADALKAYLMALKQDRNLFEAHFNLGSLYFEESNWVEAERSLRVFLGVEANRGRADAWNLLGQCEAQLRKPDDAERSFTTALKLEPNRADLWNQLGSVQASRRRLPVARQSFQTALRLDPAFAPARLNLAVVSQQLGDKAGALLSYRAYLDGAPQAANANEVRALIRQLEGGQPRPAPAQIQTNLSALVVPASGTNGAALTKAPLATVASNAVVLRPGGVATRAVPPSPRSASESNPAGRSVAAAPTNAVVPLPRPVTEAKPEVVPVDESPKLQAARDGVVAPVKEALPSAAEKSRAANQSAASATNGPAAGGTAVVPPVSPLTAESTPPPARGTPVNSAATPTSKGGKEAATRPGFWGRVNPVRWGNPVKWFKADGTTNQLEKPATPLTPPAAVVKSPTVAPATRLRPVTNAVAELPPTKPAVAIAPAVLIPAIQHYTPRGPQSFAAGDRAAAEAQFSAGLAAYDRRDLAGALDAYQKSVDADPTYFPARHNLGWTALESGEVSRALLAGEAAARLDPGSAAGHRLFAAALQRGNYPAEAAAQLERVLAVEPNDAPAHFALAGFCARSLGQLAKAREHYLRVLELNPKHPQEAAIRVWLTSHP